MMIRALKRRVVNNSTTLKKNEYLATKDAMRTKPNRYRLGLDSLVLEGPGAWQLERYFGQDGIEEILLSEITGKTIHEILDDLCLYGTLHVDMEIADQGLVLNLTITFVKNIEEGKKYLAEYYVPRVE